MPQHVTVLDYDPAWPEAYARERKAITGILGDNCLAIYHIGSTSVPGLPAKPIIDIMAAVRSLEQVDEGGDLDIVGEIIGYDVKAMGITANEVASQNRLTVNVKIYFTNNKYPEDNIEQSFSAYADFDATQSLDAVESTLCEDIIDQLVEDIFNATVAQW